MQEETMLKLEHICKSFPGVKAVDDVTFEIKKGEIHALLGHNGAGKSTLVKIISGAYQKDAGTVTLDDEVITLTSPQHGLEKGIGMVYQALDLMPDLNGSENIFLGQRRFRNRRGFVDAKARDLEAESLIRQFGVEIDLQIPVKKLGVSRQQLIAIAKAISRQAKVVIFDEPTAALNNVEAERLFGIMRKLADAGVSLILITHRLDEVFLIADRVTLMRDGKWVVTKETGQISMKEIVGALTGVTEEEQVRTANQSSRTEEKLVSCKNISFGTVFQDVSFDLYRGEVLGITGLIGCGATEIAKALFGVCKIDRGEIILLKDKIERMTPEAAVRHKVAYISEDRKIEGLNLIGSVKDNITLTMIGEWAKAGFLNRKKEMVKAEEMVRKLDIRVAGLEQAAGTLSGGNQQKIILAKWLLKQAEIFILCEPTRGIDIGTKREIHKIIRKLAQNGCAVLVVSSEVEEIIDTCDRVMILYDGKTRGELSSEECVKKRMLDVMYGVE